MKKLLSIICVAVVVIFSGCSSVTLAQAPAVKAGNAQFALAQKIIAEIFLLYQGFTLKSFSAAIAEDFTPSASEFIANASDGFHAGNILDMNFVVDEVFAAKVMLTAKFNWQKRVLPKNETSVQLSKGNAQFTFKYIDGQWRLYRAAGDNPFIR